MSKAVKGKRKGAHEPPKMKSIVAVIATLVIFSLIALAVINNQGNSSSTGRMVIVDISGPDQRLVNYPLTINIKNDMNEVASASDITILIEQGVGDGTKLTSDEFAWPGSLGMGSEDEHTFSITLNSQTGNIDIWLRYKDQSHSYGDWLISKPGK